MEKIQFRADARTIQQEISVEEWEAMEMAMDGSPKIYRLRPILARYVVGDDGKLLTQAEGMRQMKKLLLSEFLGEVFPAFFEALNGAAIPNPKGSVSNLPLEASLAETLPAGPQP